MFDAIDISFFQPEVGGEGGGRGGGGVPDLQLLESLS